MIEPKLDRKFVEETLSNKAEELEKILWGSSPYKDFGDLSGFLENVFGSLSMTAALALYCLENKLGHDFYERANAYLYSDSGSGSGSDSK